MPEPSLEELVQQAADRNRNAALREQAGPDMFLVVEHPFGHSLHLRVEAAALESAIARVPGVAEVSVHGRYQLYVVVGQAWAWEECLPGIREVIEAATAGVVLDV